MTELDWGKCPDAERTPGKMSGAWCLKGTRIRCEDIITQSYGCTPEEIAGPDIYPELDVALVRRILAYARSTSWPACPDAEKRGGQWVVKGSTVPVQTIIDESWDGQMPQTTAELHGLRLDVVRRILAFAGCFGRHEMTPPP